MKVKISKKGPEFSRIIAGVMNWGPWGANFDSSQQQEIIEACIEMGITTFDHADIYGHYTNEASFGTVLKNNPELRSKMEIISKCGIKLTHENRPNHKIKSYDTSAKHIEWSVNKSLENLGTDYIDLLLIHRPSPLMNPAEIAKAFDKLKISGKVNYFGVSNFTPSQFEMLNQYTPLVSNQIEASVLHRTPFLDGSLDTCLKHGIKPMAWSPLGAGKIFAETEEANISRLKTKGQELAEKHSVGLDQLLLAWLMKHPSGILPVLGTTKIDRLKNALKATNVELSDEEWFELWEAAEGNEVP